MSDYQKEFERFFSGMADEVCSLFEGKFSNDEVLSYMSMITNKVRANDKIMQLVISDTKMQSMDNGFPEAVTDVVIDSFGTHQNIAKHALMEGITLHSLQYIVYRLLVKGLKRSNQAEIKLEKGIIDNNEH